MPDYSNVPRDSRRVPIATKVQFKFDRFSGFLSEYSANISPTGLFIVTKTPEPAGRVLELEFHLGDGFEIIKGNGEVVWTRTVADGPHRPAGMGLRFLELSPGSKDLIYRIVDQYVLAGGTPFDLIEAGGGVAASSSAPSRVPAEADDLLAPLPPLDLEPDPFPDLEPEPLKESSSNVLPWRRPPDLRMVEEPGLEPAGEIFALEEPGALPVFESRPDPLSLPSLPSLPTPAPFAASVPSSAADELFASYLPKPAEPPEPTMSRTLSSLAGSASAQAERRLAPWVLGLVLLCALAAAGILFRDDLLGLIGLGDDGEEVAAAPTTRPQELPLRRTQPAVPPPPSASAAPGLTSDVEPAKPAPALETTTAPDAAPREPAAEEPLPEVVQRKPAPEPAAVPAVSAVERITLEPTAGSTVVVLWGNGVFQPQSYSQSRMDGPPRSLIRLTGIRRPFSPTRIPVGTPQVRQVRTGYHEKAGGNELHIVLDLGGPGVKITRIDQDGQRLRIHLEGP